MSRRQCMHWTSFSAANSTFPSSPQTFLRGDVIQCNMPRQNMPCCGVAKFFDWAEGYQMRRLMQMILAAAAPITDPTFSQLPTSRISATCDLKEPDTSFRLSFTPHCLQLRTVARQEISV